MLGVKLMPLICVQRIHDGASRFHCIILHIRIVVRCLSFDLPLTPTILPCVFQRSSSIALNLDCYNSLGGRLRFTLFNNTNHHPIKVCRVLITCIFNLNSYLI